MVRLAAEVVRLNRNIATLKEGVDQIIAGTEFILMPKGPFADGSAASMEVKIKRSHNDCKSKCVRALN